MCTGLHNSTSFRGLAVIDRSTPKTNKRMQLDLVYRLDTFGIPECNQLTTLWNPVPSLGQ